jgi:hypothetical protein
MYIHIHQDAVLREIKAEFRAAFPFLKLEFFQRPHSIGAVSPRREMHSDKLKIRELPDSHNEGQIALLDTLSVADLEADFEKRFDLHVQVFRKSGTLWLETSATDHWSLGQQNQHGAEAEESPAGEDSPYTANAR